MAELLTIALGRFLLMLISLLNVRLYTTYLAHDQVGRLALLSGMATILSLLIDRSVSAYWYRMVRPWARARVGASRMRRLLLSTLALSILLLAVSGVIARTIGLGTPISWGWLILICGASVFFNSAYNALLGSINVLGQRRTFVGLGVCGAGCGLLVAMLLTRSTPRAEWWMLGTILSQAAFFPILLVVALRSMTRIAGEGAMIEVPEGDADQVTRAWWRFAVPALFAAVLYAAQMLGYRFALNAVAGPSRVAIFTVGFGIGVAIMNAFDYFATQFLLPHFLAGIESFERERMATAWNRYAAALMPATILVGALAAGGGPLIIRLLAAPSFAAAGYLVAWGVAADALRLLTQGMTLVSQARLEMRHVLLPSMAGVVTSLGGVLLLARANPLDGTGLALVAGGVVWLLLQYRASRALLPIRLPWRQMVGACGAAVPLIAGLRWGITLNEDATPLLTVAILALAGLYVVIVGYLLLAPSWIAMGRSAAPAASVS
ncbi:MAG: hypothetical protein U0132_02540 [Gemmatimonadaceae bacterium]